MRRERPRFQLTTSRKFAELVVSGISGDGHFSGYASVFGEVDLGKDVIERGAFSRSIARKGPEGVRMLYQHDPAEPIGRWQLLREDGRGLYVEGQLTLGAKRADEVYAHLKNRALDGLSIGFRTVRAATDPKSGIRRILEADLWEISVVTFPMLPSARVVSVKAGRAHRVTPASHPDLARRIDQARRTLLASLGKTRTSTR
nr:HK97 family phage prohead protease [uncultured Gellertiella sp.]